MHGLLIFSLFIGSAFNSYVYMPVDTISFKECKVLGNTVNFLISETNIKELPYNLNDDFLIDVIERNDYLLQNHIAWIDCHTYETKFYLKEIKSHSINVASKRLLIINPFDNNRIIKSLEMLQYLQLDNAFTAYISLLILIVSITLLISIVFCHKFEFKPCHIVEKRFAFINIFSWEYLINKLKRIRVQNSIMKSKRSRNKSDDDTSKYRDSIKNSEQNAMRNKLEEELITLKTNEKILISAYFSKLRNHFKIEEDNISTTSSNIIHYTSKKRKSKRKKKGTQKSSMSKQLQTFVEKEELSVESHADNELNYNSNDYIFISEGDYKPKDSSDGNSQRDTSQLSVSTSEIDSTDSNSSVVICPITALSFKNMILVQIKNSANYISIFYQSNRVMNTPDIIFFSAFKLLLLFYISALLSPCDIEYSDTYKISKEYLFSIDSIKVYLACCVISLPFTTLIYWMLKKRIIDSAYSEELILQTERYFWLYHIIAYVIVILIGILGLINTTWISIYNLNNRISNTFYYDFITIFVFEISIRQAVLIIIPSIIYLKIFEDSTITFCKKGLILITWFL